ncbi:hypothetical protein Z949_549 [Sulfitobacter guttiformis KCTC 32187]|uniref:Uncharacterized protein n=1 Tax=Sulfitobacter guttiformis TaxID=74349 RepID=A0A420DUB2_9RHOB|nr:hypothetical protein [Sulfitobacter guttiformis]KIN71389.1 hypothetical protein Z949_549 [Sulfitobacter guttiformis KCTC 32187]RKE97835.1 hypothetical protein C8N30_2464 [Sulfitobacter guttiformis]
MRSDWILDVLADLRSFAEANDLPKLAEQLDDTALIATAEFASKDARSAERRDVGQTEQIRGHIVRIGTGGNA